MIKMRVTAWLGFSGIVLILTAAVSLTVLMNEGNAVAAKRSPRTKSTVLLRDAFDTLSNWKLLWGDIVVENSTGGNNEISLASKLPASLNETYSALAISRVSAENFSYAVTTKTIEPLRQGDKPNAWEVGWIFFRYRDLENYYYFILKPNGYELGKKHGSDTQIFLATGELPKLEMKKDYRLQITAVGGRIRGYIDGQQIFDYTDPNPILSGAVGLYEEDAHVHFDNVLLTRL